MKRGRQPVPCPDSEQLRAAYALDRRPAIIAEHIGANVKQVRRWLGEIGIELPPLRKQRPRGVTPRYVGVARTPDGRRVTARLYNIFDAMRKRCHRPSSPNFKFYGARGISVCAEWIDDYHAFRAWAIAHGYAKDLTLDRIRNAEGYSPGNCRWATREEQTYNSSRVHSLTLRGVTKLLPIWAKELGFSPFLLRTRRSAGWTDEQILTTPRLTNGQVRPNVQHRPRGRRPRSVISHKEPR